MALESIQLEVFDPAGGISIMRDFPLASIISIPFIGLLFIFSACNLAAEPKSNFPFELLMIPQDLPSGWVSDGYEFPEIISADTRRAFFLGSNDPNKEYILISHTLSVYPTEQAAEKAYPDWEMHWFPTDNWVAPEGSSYVTDKPGDRQRLACIHVSINGNPIMSCRYLKQHSNMISLVLANIDDDAISLLEFENALQKIDGRMQDYAHPN